MIKLLTDDVQCPEGSPVGGRDDLSIVKMHTVAEGSSFEFHAVWIEPRLSWERRGRGSNCG
jgi:hypothetical protein